MPREDLPTLERRLLDRGPASAQAPEAQAEEEAREQTPQGPLCCVRCGHPITHERHRTTVLGRHTHTRINPAGYLFHFGCFSQAQGCLVVGPPTSEASWFAGYLWQFACCATCHTHLGWAFLGPETSFFGLVLERLASPS